VENEEVMIKRASANTIGMMKTVNKRNRVLSHRVLCRWLEDMKIIVNGSGYSA
jgi:hypothetical protein